ncbi:MAG: aldo/keto reductase [Candidatus Latescibacterota bacterium]
MEYAALGNTHLRVSRLGLGTVELGMPYGVGLPDPPPDSQCYRLLEAACHAGITFFDTAAAYGRSEEIVGRALGGRPEVVVATKVGIGRPDGPGPLQGAALRRQLDESVGRSLRLLRADSLSLVQLHSLDPAWLTGDLLEAMADLSRRGWVRHWGASTYGEEAAAAVMALGEPFRALQVAYNALDRRLGRSALPAARRAGLGIILRSAFLKGVLSERLHRLPASLAPLQRAALRVEAVGQQAGIPLPDLALRFAAHSPLADVALFGTASLAEMERNLAAWAAGPLPGDVLEALQAIEVVPADLLNPSTWGI